MKKIAGRNNKNNISKTTRTVQKGATGNECESSDSDIPQVDGKKLHRKNERTEINQHCQGRNQGN